MQNSGIIKWVTLGPKKTIWIQWTFEEFHSNRSLFMVAVWRFALLDPDGNPSRLTTTWSLMVPKELQEDLEHVKDFTQLGIFQQHKVLKWYMDYYKTINDQK